MLIKNPITEILYEGEYNGVENIHDFWRENRDDLLLTINKHENRILAFDSALEAFELKIRWSSYYGLWFRFYTNQYCSSHQGHIDFNDISIPYGGKPCYLEDFIGKLSTFVEPTSMTDLRGVSLLKMRLDSAIIIGVDFSHASFDHSRFKSVVFKNCRFDACSFTECSLEDCQFDDQCSLVGADFTDAYVNSHFDCKVESPVINTPRFNLFQSYFKGRQTRIINGSFYS